MDSIDLMRSFVTVAETQGFTAAGVRLGKSKALISKHIGELERRLGARLLNRTTRQVSLTAIGRAYAERARALVAEFDTLEDAVRSETGVPRGVLKVTAPQALGETTLMEMAASFRNSYPEVELDVLLTDRMVELISEGFEVALRVTSMADSSLIARKICETRLILAASPGYLAQNGMPASPVDLGAHRCIIDSVTRGRENWRFSGKSGPGHRVIRVQPSIVVNGATAVRRLLLEGAGIAFCPEFAIARDIREGRLVAVLEDAVHYPLDVQLVYPHRLHLSAKVRAFIDFTVEWYMPTPPWMRAGPPE